MGSTLREFVTFFRSEQRRGVPLFRRLEDIYAQVWPCPFEDRDLRTFLATLYLGVRHFRPEVVVQTGTFVGTSSIAIALAMKENRCGRLYTIDPEPPEYFGIKEPVTIARRAAAAGKLEAHVSFIKGYSTIPRDRTRMQLPEAPWWRLLHLPTPPTWHMLVVDGDHTQDGCYFDLEYGTLRLVRGMGGLVVVHDYLGIPEVRRAVRKWRGCHEGSQMAVVPSPCGIALIQV